MTKNKKIALFLGLFVGLFVTALLLGGVHAQTNSYVPSFLQVQYTNGARGINTLIHNIIEFVFAIAGLVVLAYIIWAGFKFITSGGDSGKKEEAQKQIVAAVIGLLIIVFSFFIVQLIFSLLGIGSVSNIELPCGANGQPVDSSVTDCAGAPTATP